MTGYNNSVEFVRQNKNDRIEKIVNELLNELNPLSEDGLYTIMEYKLREMSHELRDYLRQCKSEMVIEHNKQIAHCIRHLYDAVASLHNDSEDKGQVLEQARLEIENRLGGHV